MESELEQESHLIPIFNTIIDTSLDEIEVFFIHFLCRAGVYYHGAGEAGFYPGEFHGDDTPMFAAYGFTKSSNGRITPSDHFVVYVFPEAISTNNIKVIGGCEKGWEVPTQKLWADIQRLFVVNPYVRVGRNKPAIQENARNIYEWFDYYNYMISSGQRYTIFQMVTDSGWLTSY